MTQTTTSPNTFCPNRAQIAELTQIFEELKFAVHQAYTEEGMVKLLSAIAKESAGQTLAAKRAIAKNLYRSAKKLTQKCYTCSKTKLSAYQRNGFEHEFKGDYGRFKNFVRDSPKNVKGFSIRTKHRILTGKDNFLAKTREEKVELITVALFSVLLFFVSAGGADFEGGIPDTDLKLGIGFHRNIFSHSIIAGLLVEMAMRFGIGAINKNHAYLPEGHHPFWDHIHTYINKHKGAAIGAMWAGISVHLIQDANLLNAATKPYTGIPFHLPMEAHQGLFAANGGASALFAAKS